MTSDPTAKPPEKNSPKYLPTWMSVSIDSRIDVKPCEPDSSRETEQDPAHNRQLTSWQARVRVALAQNDQQQLVELFTEMKTFVPADQVSHIWLTEVSGWDARASTG